MSELDPKRLDAAITAAFSIRENGSIDFDAAIETAIRAYLEAAPSPSPAPGVVEALTKARDYIIGLGQSPQAGGWPRDQYAVMSEIETALASLSQPANPAQGVNEARLPATKAYVDRLIRIFNERPTDDTSAVVLVDYARAALTAAIGTGRSPEPEFETAPDNGTPAEVLAYVLDCARRWVPEARIIGNARAGDIERAIAAIVSAEAAEAERDRWKIEYLNACRDAASFFDDLVKAEAERDRLAVGVPRLREALERVLNAAGCGVDLYNDEPGREAIRNARTALASVKE